MTLKAYTGHLACDNPDVRPTHIGPMQACQDVLNSMPVATYDQIFGKREIPANVISQVLLPVTISDGEAPSSSQYRFYLYIYAHR